MKIITIIAVILLSISTHSFADQPQTELKPICTGTRTYIQKSNNGVVLSGYYYFNIVNETSSHQYFDVTMKVCSDNGKCKTQEIKHIHQNPNGFFVSPQYGLEVLAHYDRVGDYHFTVSIDITGYKTLHAEKTCWLAIRKP